MGGFYDGRCAIASSDLSGFGELKAVLKLTVNHATPSAREAVEKAGGSVTLIEKKVLAADEEKRAKTARKKAVLAKPKAARSEE